MAIYGTKYTAAAKDTITLLKQCGLMALINDCIISPVFTISILFGGLVTGAVAWAGSGYGHSQGCVRGTVEVSALSWGRPVCVVPPPPHWVWYLYAQTPPPPQPTGSSNFDCGGSCARRLTVMAKAHGAIELMKVYTDGEWSMGPPPPPRLVHHENARNETRWSKIPLQNFVPPQTVTAPTISFQPQQQPSPPVQATPVSKQH